MNLFRNRYRSWLVPYVDGTLDARQQAKLEALLAHDLALAAEAEAQRHTVKRLHETALTQAPEEEPASLWPAIEARLASRRRSVTPFLLAGGLCAAAASLAWAAFWGPLKRWGEPTRPVAVATNSPGGDTGGVTIVGGLSPRHPRHPRHKLHRSNSLVKRPDSLQPAPKTEPGNGEDSQEESGDQLADSSPSSNSGGTDSTDGATPKLAFGLKSHFHLAPLIHPIGHEDAQGDGGNAPGQPSSESVPAKDDAASTDGTDSSPDAAPAETATDQSTSDHPAVTHRSHRRHRRHRRSREAAVSAKTSDQKMPVGAAPPEAKPSDDAVPKPHTVKPGLID